MDVASLSLMEVSQCLRSLNHPIRHFGEGEAEIRQRLADLRPSPSLLGASKESPAGINLRDWRLNLVKAAESARDSRLGRWEPTEPLVSITQVNSIIAHTRPGLRVRVHPEGPLLSASIGGEVFLWNSQLEKTRLDRPMTRVQALEFGSPSQYFLGTAEGPIEVYPGDTQLQGHTNGVVDLILFLKTNLFSVSLDGTYKVWDLPTQSCILTQPVDGHPLKAGTVHPDGNLAAVSDASGITRLWDLRTGLLVTQLGGHTAELTTNHWCPQTGYLLATGSADNSVRLWDLRKRENVSYEPLFTFMGHVKPVSKCLFLGGSLITSGYDAKLMVWDLKNLKPKGEALGHAAKITGFDAHAGKVASISFDRTIKFWELAVTS